MKTSMGTLSMWRTLTWALLLLMGSGLVYAQNALLGMRGYVQDGVEFLRLDFAQEVLLVVLEFHLQYLQIC